MVINNEFNKLQINEVIDRDASGNIVKRSLMLNIRCNDVQEADQLYRQLKAKINSATAVKRNDSNGNVPICACGRQMVLRQGRNGQFYGCAGYPKCRLTRELSEFVQNDETELEEVQVC